MTYLQLSKRFKEIYAFYSNNISEKVELKNFEHIRYPISRDNLCFAKRK